MTRSFLVSMLALAACTKEPVESDTDVVVEQVDADDDGYYESADCDDTNKFINPDAREICDEIDNDCDGNIDDADSEVSGAPRWHRDDDRDGYGAQFDTKDACKQPNKYVLDGTDCDDNNPEVSPEGSEICGNELDDDCDGLTDAGKWYYDTDHDGYGSEAVEPSLECEQPADTVKIRKDCDDTRADVNPDGTEVCGDAVDQDCDGESQLCEFAPDDCDIYFTLGDNPAGADPSADALGGDMVVTDINGDGTGDAAIGAPSATDPYTGAYTAVGRVYLFTGGPDEGLLKTTVDTFATISDTEASGFGVSISALGDITGDARSDLAVGGPYATAGAGRVWVFSGSDVTGAVSASSARTILTTDSLEQLGHIVSGGGDLDGDGARDLVVSAWGRPIGTTSGGASITGRIYAIDGTVTGTETAESAALFTVDAPADFTTIYNFYGLGSVASSVGDVDGDGLGDVLAGAAIWGDTAAGRAYVFSGATTGSVDTSAAMTVYEGAASDLLGWSATRLGDLDGDGKADFALGALYHSSVQSQAGGVYVVHGGGTGPLNVADIATALVSGDTAAQSAGFAVAAGDVDGDDAVDLCIGSPNAVSDTGAWNGAAWVISDIGSKSGASVVTDAALKFYDSRSPGAANFGAFLSADGDFTGDGKDDLLLSAPNIPTTTPDGANTGIAFLFTTF